ncbi:hypothetical protein AUP68_01765 [Ilyonectria robusta]
MPGQVACPRQPHLHYDPIAPYYQKTLEPLPEPLPARAASYHSEHRPERALTMMDRPERAPAAALTAAPSSNQ